MSRQHDPLCPAAGVARWENVDKCGPCDLIAAVREDERERAWNRPTGGDR